MPTASINPCSEISLHFKTHKNLQLAYLKIFTKNDLKYTLTIGIIIQFYLLYTSEYDLFMITL